jgi:hypothetical protein
MKEVVGCFLRTLEGEGRTFKHQGAEGANDLAMGVGVETVEFHTPGGHGKAQWVVRVRPLIP